MTDRIEWGCAVCDKPIDDGDGYLVLSDHDERAYYEHRGGQADAGEAGGPARWRAVHAACDPDPKTPDYRIAIDRLRTDREVLAWTVNLAGNGFVDSSNWIEVVGLYVVGHDFWMVDAERRGPGD
jgi:hypothetical protein